MSSVNTMQAEQQKENVEIDDNGNTIIKNENGEVFATIPKGFEVVESEDSFILVNKNAKADAVLELKGNRIQLDKDSQISFSEKNGESLIQIESGSIEIGETLVQGVQNANIKINEDNQIDFAEFSSREGGEYNFNYNEKDFKFNAEKGGKVLFNPKENILSGENVELNLDNQLIKAESFQAGFDGENIDSVKLKGGVYEDKRRNLEYSSDEEFSVYLDGRRIDNEDNAISVLSQEDETHIYGKGSVKILNNDKLSYTGESPDALVDYYVEDNSFDIKKGDAVLKNNNRIVNVKQGSVFLNKKHSDSNGDEAESFRVKTYKDGEEFENIIDEKGGQLTIASSKNGETKAVVVSFDNYEKYTNNLVDKVIGDRSIEDAEEYLNELKLDGKTSKADLDLAELAILEQKNMNSLKNVNVFSLDESITRLEDYLEEPRDVQSEYNAKLSLAELYKESGDVNAAEGYYKQIIKERFSDLDDSQARLGLADIYLERKDYKNAKWAFVSLDGSESDEIKSISEFGKSYSDLLAGGRSTEQILTGLDKSLELNPNNEQARKLKTQVELNTLKQIDKGINEQMVKFTEGYHDTVLGDIESDDGYFSILGGETARGIGIGMGSASSVSSEYRQKTGIGDLQRDAGFAMQKLLSEGEFSSVSEINDYINQIKSNVPESPFVLGLADSKEDVEAYFEEASFAGQDFRNKIARAYNKDPNSEFVIEKAIAIDYALNLPSLKNSDFQKLANKGYYNNQFQLGDYMDPGNLEPGFLNELESGMDLKNAILFTGLGATVKGTTIAQWGGKVIRAIPGVGKTVEGFNVAKTTVGASNSFNLLRNSPKLNKVTSFVGGEVVESITGGVVEKFLPGWGLPTEVLLGHSQVAEMAEAITKEVGVKAGTKVLFTEGMDPIYGLEFSNTKEFRKFVSENVPKSEQIKVAFASDFIYEINGKKFLAYPNQLGEVLEAGEQIIKGESTYLQNYQVRSMTDAESNLFNSAGAHVGSENLILVDAKKINELDLDQASKEAYIKGVVAHEFFHSKFKSLPEIQKDAIYDSFIDHPNWAKTKETFLQERKLYGSRSDKQLVNEILAHAGERKYRVATDCESIGYCDAYETLLTDVETSVLARFEAPEFIEGKVNQVVDIEELLELQSKQIEMQAQAAASITESISTPVKVRADAKVSQEKFLNLAEDEKLTIYPMNARAAELDNSQLFMREDSKIARIYDPTNPQAIHQKIPLTTYKGWKEDANIGRVFDLDSHLKEGKFMLYDNPADGKYIWTIDKDGGFNIGLRSEDEFTKYRYAEKSSSESKTLPHTVLAEGKPVFGAGEVVFKDGKVLKVNAISGHYVDKLGSIEFNKNSVNAFKTYSEIKGLEFDSNIEFDITSPKKVVL